MTTKRRKPRKEKYIKSKLLSNGLYSFQVYLRYIDLDGNNQLYSQSFSEKEYGGMVNALNTACHHRDEMIIKLRSGTYTSHKKGYTVKDVLDESYSILQVSVRTKQKHYSAFRIYLPQFNTMDFKDVTVVDIQKSLNVLVNTNNDDCINRVWCLWKRVYKTALMLNLTDVDLTLKVTVPRSKVVQNRKSVVTDYDTLLKVVNVLRTKKSREKYTFDRTILSYALMVMYYTGLRPSECFALHRDDVDLVNDILYINKRIGSNIDAINVIVSPKTDNAVRTIPILPALKVVFTEVMEYQDNDYLFVEFDGNFINTSHACTRLNIVAKELNVEFNMYRLRHLFGTNLIKSQADSRTIMELMGHANFDMSVSYARSNMDDKTDTLKKINS